MTTIALAGSPNAGKTALFNAITGANQRIGNYPGVTVEKKIGRHVAENGKTYSVIDLPGTYSLDPHSPDEEIAVQVLTKPGQLTDVPDAIVAVADATNLERTLGLVLEVRKLGKPCVAALNMMDLAHKRGLRLNLEKLSYELKVPVVPTVAVRKEGIAELFKTVDAAIEVPSATPGTYQPPTQEELVGRYQEIDRILKLATEAPGQVDQWSRRLDAVLLHRVWGGAILAMVLFLIFQAVFTWAEAPMTWIEDGVGMLGGAASAIVPAGLVQSLIVDGLIAGVGSVIVFLPQILILFFFIFLMEGSGYMMRAAFIMDRIMAMVGLQGRAFVPLLSSFACAIPGIMATRTIKNPRDRLLTIMIAPLMTCSARLPVYVLLIGAFIPNTPVLGVFRMQGLVMFGLFLVGVVSAMLVAWVMQLTSLKGQRAPMIMELPSYKWPNVKYLFMALWQRTKVFCRKAGTLIMLVSVVLWVLSTFPQAPADYEQPPINYSIAGRIGHAIEPVLKPIGFDWRIGTGLIPGFAAREVMVGALGTVFAVEDAENEESGLPLLQSKIASTWTVATGLALLAWYIFAPQCLATIAVAKRETNSWKWPSIMFFYMLGMAYLAAFVTYRVASLFGA